jgi:hypothetical protein
MRLSSLGFNHRFVPEIPSVVPATIQELGRSKERIFGKRRKIEPERDSDITDKTKCTVFWGSCDNLSEFNKKELEKLRKRNTRVVEPRAYVDPKPQQVKQKISRWDEKPASLVTENRTNYRTTLKLKAPKPPAIQDQRQKDDIDIEFERFMQEISATSSAPAPVTHISTQPQTLAPMRQRVTVSTSHEKSRQAIRDKLDAIFQEDRQEDGSELLKKRNPKPRSPKRKTIEELQVSPAAILSDSDEESSDYFGLKKQDHTPSKKYQF